MKKPTHTTWFQRGQRVRQAIARPMNATKRGLDHAQSGIRGFARGLILNKEPSK